MNEIGGEFLCSALTRMPPEAVIFIQHEAYLIIMPTACHALSLGLSDRPTGVPVTMSWVL